MQDIALDKILHFLVCFIVTVMVAFVIQGIVNCSGGKIPMLACAAIGLASAILLGFAKEVLDHFEKHNFDKYDLLADLLGALVGFFLALLT